MKAHAVDRTTTFDLDQVADNTPLNLSPFGDLACFTEKNT